jgi:hypothetical protein
MKTITSFYKILFFVSVFANAQAFANTPDPADVEPELPATNPFTASGASQISSCDSAQGEIRNFCSGNPDLLMAQRDQGLTSNFDTGTAEGAREGIRRGESSIQSLNQIRQACSAAAQQCMSVCRDEINQQHVPNMRTAQSVPDPARAQQEQQEIDRKNEIARSCKAQEDEMNAKAGSMQADLASVIQALAQLLQSLGAGGGEEVAETDIDYESCDPEKNPMADSMINCQGQSDPKGTRGGLTGIASLQGGGDPLNGLPQVAESGEPGGTPRDNGGNGAGAGSGFGAAGFGGGFGNNGAAGAVEAASAGEEGGRGDGFGGFHGVSGSGGGGGGGGGFPRSGGYKGGSSSGGNNVNAAGLQRKLDKYAAKSRSARSPASAGGANGPFQDNWEVIKRAYKKNSSTMFHQSR